MSAGVHYRDAAEPAPEIVADARATRRWSEFFGIVVVAMLGLGYWVNSRRGISLVCSHATAVCEVREDYRVFSTRTQFPLERVRSLDMVIGTRGPHDAKRTYLGLYVDGRYVTVARSHPVEILVGLTYGFDDFRKDRSAPPFVRAQDARPAGPDTTLVAFLLILLLAPTRLRRRDVRIDRARQSLTVVDYSARSRWRPRAVTELPLDAIRTVEVTRRRAIVEHFLVEIVGPGGSRTAIWTLPARPTAEKSAERLRAALERARG